LGFAGFVVGGAGCAWLITGVEVTCAPAGMGVV
jgi:hypothetical protein